MVSCPKCESICPDDHQFCPSCGVNLQRMREGGSRDPFIGMTISGKFVLQELIGSGGMGKVYRADHIGVGRTVAVKIMHRHLMGDETASARFTNEARACSQLNHPNTISVLDFGQTPEANLYIVYEYLRGRSLDAVLRHEFPIRFGRVAGILCQAMDALEAAHSLGIIHRDLKPENMFLEQTSGLDFVKVLDFGIAKILALRDRSITSPGMVPGTPEYMSPEQARGEELDPRSDVYSLGVILYEMLTNSVPFAGSSAVATMMSHVQDPPEPPSQRRPDRQIPQDLESIVLRALAKKTEDRIGSAAEFRDLLAGWAEKSNLWPHRRPKEPPPVGVPEGAPRDVLVSRDEEIERLEQFLTRSKRSRVMRIQAPVGMGKTRLIEEAMRRATGHGMEVIHCPPDRGWTTAPLGAMQRAALRCLGLQQEEPGTEEVLQAAGGLGLPSEDIPGLKELFGIPGHLSELETAARRRERSAAFIHMIHLAAMRRPLLLVFEAIQRYDDPSRDLVAALATVSSEAPVAILITHPPDFIQLWPPDVAMMEIPPLGPSDSATLVRSIRGADTPDYLVRNVYQIGQGNPLFMEQMAFARELEGMEHPPTKVADFIAARIDRLPQNEREILQWMAVVNNWMTGKTLSRLCSSFGDMEILNVLEEGKGFLKRSADGRSYTFRHHLIAMVIFSSIPAEVRRGIHLKVADHLRRLNAPLSTLAFHSYEGDDGLRAIEELDQAATWAKQLLDLRTAKLEYSRALDMVRREWGKGRMSESDLEQLAVNLARRLGEVLRQSDEPHAARGILEEALSIAAGNDISRAELRFDMGRIDLEHGNLQRAARHLELARTDAQHGRSDFLLSEVLKELARVTGLSGDQEGADALILESLAIRRRASGHRRMASWETLLEMAITSIQIGLEDRARSYLLDALKEADIVKSIPGKLRVIRQMAELHANSSEWSESLMRLEQALELAAQVGDRAREAAILVEIGRIHRTLGDMEQARQMLDRAVQRARAVGWWEGIKHIDREIDLLKLAAPPAL